MTKSRVAVLRVEPATVLASIERLCDLAGMKQALDPKASTILKDNISWHFPFPAANTTPWQLEGTILALRRAGFADLSCVQNKTVVTDAFKGEDLNHYLPVFAQYNVPVLYNFKPQDITWVPFRPKAKMRVLDRIYPEGINIPEYFIGKNIVHLPTVKCISGDTEVVLGDGSVSTIRQVVDNQIGRAWAAHLDHDGDVRVDGRVEMFGMDSLGKVRALEATSFWRTSRRGRRVLRMKTRTGRSLTASIDHKIHTPDGWTPLGDLVVGSRVAIARFPSEDLAWDHVASIEDVSDSEDDLYDVTIPEGSSFVANGLIVHNCHIYTTTTGAMKNAFGGLLHNHRHYTHSWIHETLVDLLAIQKEIHTGIFAVMDGTTAGNGPGPRTMFPVVKNVMLASADQVAIDAVAAKMMGIDPLSIDYIRIAHEDRLGVGDPRDIELVGDDVSNESWGFKVGDNGASRVGDLLWFSPFKVFQKLFFRTPLVNIFILGSETYHDFYRWPLKDRRTFERWRCETAWGQLFERYASGPVGPAPSPAGEPPPPVPVPRPTV